MTPAKETHTPPRQIRIGDNWAKLDLAAKATGTTRAEIVNALIAYFLHEPGAKQPKRPDRALWDPEADSAAP